MSKLPSDRIQLLRAQRLVGKPGLKPAVDLADYLAKLPNSVVAAGLQPEVAAHIASELRKAGAVVAVEASVCDRPMLCCPGVNQKYEWAFWRRVRRAGQFGR